MDEMEAAQSPAAGSDALGLLVYDRNDVLYKNVPTNTLLQGGNILVHQK